jgi:hypothetical protein
MSMPATRHRFTVDDWHQMIEAGVLRDDQRWSFSTARSSR